MPNNDHLGQAKTAVLHMPCTSFVLNHHQVHIEQVIVWVFHVVHVHVYNILECEDTGTCRCGQPCKAARHSCDVTVVDEGKIDQLVSNLGRYHVVVVAFAGIQMVCG